MPGLTVRRRPTGWTFRSIGALALAPLVTLAASVAAIAWAPWDPGGRRIHDRIVKRWASAILRLAGVRLRVLGLHHLGMLPPPYIVVSNHQSQLDIPALVAALPIQARFVGKVELSRVPVFGAAVARAGHVFLDRSDHSQALGAIHRAGELARRLGVSFVFAPEGTRSADGRLHPFKKGPFVLAIETGIPVLPVVIRGTGACLPKGSLLARRGTVEVEILPPQTTEGLSYDDRDTLRDSVHGAMEPLVGRQSWSKGLGPNVKKG